MTDHHKQERMTTMEKKMMYALVAWKWNPNSGDEGEYEAKTVKYFDSKDSAVKSINRRTIDSDTLMYDIEEGWFDKYGHFNNERRIMRKDAMGIDTYVMDYDVW